jgi:hypothetical protein
VSREYAVPEELVEGWLASAERAIRDSLDMEFESRRRKLYAIAKRYRKLKEENEELRERHRKDDG